MEKCCRFRVPRPKRPSLKVKNYIPEASVFDVESLINRHNFSVKIVNQRQSKHGDFRRLPNGKFQITINNNLNPNQFLLTLIHEIAHYLTFKTYGQVQPHGKEWKLTFQKLMLPFLRPEVYPKSILPYLANYLKNPKASTDSDVKLSLALRNFEAELGKKFIFDLPCGAEFEFKNKRYRKGSIRRTRYECLEIQSNRVYLFNQNTEVNYAE